MPRGAPFCHEDSPFVIGVFIDIVFCKSKCNVFFCYLIVFDVEWIKGIIETKRER